MFFDVDEGIFEGSDMSGTHLNGRKVIWDSKWWLQKKKNGRSAKKALRQGLKPVKIDIYGSKIFNFKILSFFWFLNDPIGIQ